MAGKRARVAVVCLTLCLGSFAVVGEEPDLPSGLAGEEPDLPMGMGEDEPDIPFGIDSSSDSEEPDFAWVQPDQVSNGDSAAQQFGVTGFWEARAGYRVQDPVDQRHWSLAETRLELEKDFHWQGWNAKVTTDLLYDDVEPSLHNDLESGSGWLDVREAWVQRRLGERMDIKAGRQILTWGVGDLLFINDLFPKDWNSFLAGRDEQYLKAPSDALRIGLYSDVVNLNLIYTPRFDSDRYIDGRRLSYFNPMVGDVVGRDSLVAVDLPDNTGSDDELALRLYRQLGSFEVAAYGYQGFWKSPVGFDPLEGLATFPRLNVYGASLRGPFGPGILSAETGYYDSRDDSNGSDPFINNSEWRGLVGYEWEVATDTTLALQYYVEVLQDYSAYQASLFPGQEARDEYRQLLTVRFTRLAMNQNLTWSLFGFISPTDQDFYLRPKVSYKVSDSWLVEGGFNLFDGDDKHTFFGQFESNSNAYMGVRYSF